MKVLVIPDLHGRKFWRETIQNNIEKVDKIIFLGDYLDPYPYEIEDNPELMECKSSDDAFSLLNMLKDIVSLKKNEPEKYILLTGNHTDSYIWSEFTAGTRTDYNNWEKYYKFFSENLEYFNLVWIEDGVIFSHAGITQIWAGQVWEILEFSEDELCNIKEIAKVFKDTPLSNFNKDYIQLISNISYYRGGINLCGSCEWADIHEHLDLKKSTPENLVAFGDDNIYQIFGHTQLKGELITDKWACLDCRKGFIVDTLTHKIEKCGSNNSL